MSFKSTKFEAGLALASKYNGAVPSRDGETLERQIEIAES